MIERETQITNFEKTTSLKQSDEFDSLPVLEKLRTCDKTSGKKGGTKREKLQKKITAIEEALLMNKETREQEGIRIIAIGKTDKQGELKEQTDDNNLARICCIFPINDPRGLRFIEINIETLQEFINRDVPFLNSHADEIRTIEPHEVRNSLIMELRHINFKISKQKKLKKLLQRGKREQDRYPTKEMERLTRQKIIIIRDIMHQSFEIEEEARRTNQPLQPLFTITDNPQNKTYPNITFWITNEPTILQRLQTPETPIVLTDSNNSFTCKVDTDALQDEIQSYRGDSSIPEHVQAAKDIIDILNNNEIRHRTRETITQTKPKEGIDIQPDTEAFAQLPPLEQLQEAFKELQKKEDKLQRKQAFEKRNRAIHTVLQTPQEVRQSHGIEVVTLLPNSNITSPQDDPFTQYRVFVAFPIDSTNQRRFLEINRYNLSQLTDPDPFYDIVQNEPHCITETPQLAYNRIINEIRIIDVQIAELYKRRKTNKDITADENEQMRQELQRLTDQKTIRLFSYLENANLYFPGEKPYQLLNKPIYTLKLFPLKENPFALFRGNSKDSTRESKADRAQTTGLNIDNLRAQKQRFEQGDETEVNSAACLILEMLNIDTNQ